jgi:TRAP-type transport system periplasmic protein
MPVRIRRAKFMREAALTAASVSVISAPLRAAQFEFKCGSGSPIDHPASVRATQMWSAVERESGGRIRTQFFANSQLGTDSAMFGQMRVGALAFYMAASGVLAQVVPSVDIGNVGFAFKDEDEALRVVDGPLGDYIRREISSKGIHMMGNVWGSGMRQITSNSRPIRTAEDMSGFKIRVTASRIIVDLFKTLGASPVPLDFGELYTALQTKLVDGEDGPLLTIEAQRFFEVQKYLSITNHTWSGLWLLANLDIWKSLPPDLQAIVERNNRKYLALERRDTNQLNASVGDKLARQGLVTNTAAPTTFRARLRTYYEGCSSIFGPTAWGLLRSSVGGRLG